MHTFSMIIITLWIISCAEQQAPIPPNNSSVSSQGSSSSQAKSSDSASSSKLPKPSDIEQTNSQSNSSSFSNTSFEFGAKVGSENTRKLVSECVSKKGYYDRKSAKCESSKALVDSTSKKVINCSRWEDLEKHEALEQDGVNKIKDSLAGMNYLPDQCYDFGSYFYLYLAYQEDAKSPIQIRKFCVNNSSGCP